jgi:CDGSH-type Zn-finger protein/uncharacterized Fe-S cluster protein YjdI
MSKLHTYDSDAIQVQYDVKRCIHAAECVKRLNVVFDSGKKPWVQPANASADAIAETIHACPSGALHYTRKDGGLNEQTPDRNTLHIDPNGPLYLRGDIVLKRDDGTEDGALVLRETRLALCRCGLSLNKPYCDNTHRTLGFADAGVVNAAQEAVGDMLDASGALGIKPFPNGSVQVVGKLEIHDAQGNIYYRDETYLCRCGGSGNKPFCDGTHNSNGFAAD